MISRVAADPVARAAGARSRGASSIEGEQLARDVAVLTPAADLVVVELGIRVPERGRLRVLVHRLLPAQRRDRAEPAACRRRAGSCGRSGARARGPGCAAPSTSGAALVAAVRELLLRAATRPRAPRAACPCGTAITDNGATSAPSAARGTGMPSGHGRCTRPCSRASSRERAARRDRVTSCAPASSAPSRHRRASLRCRPSTRPRRRASAGRRSRRAVLLQHGDGHRQRRRADGRDDVAGDARSAHAEHDDVVEVVGCRERRRASQRARWLVRGRELLGQARESPSSERQRVDVTKPTRHAKVGRMPSASALASEPCVLGVVDRLGLVDQHDRDVVLTA